MRNYILTKYKDLLTTESLKKLIKENIDLDFKKNYFYKLLSNGELIQITPESSLEDINWIKDRFLYSKLFTFNKFCGDKKIGSNNIYCLFFKIKNLNVSLKETINKYYDYFKEEDKKLLKIDKKKKLKIEDKLYKLSPYLYTDSSEIIREKMLICFEKIFFEYSDMSKKEKDKSINIFYDESLENYDKYIRKYFFTKIFVNNDLCIENEGKILGIPYVNNSLNPKKPYLENKGMDIVGMYLDFEECEKLHYLHLYLSSLLEKKNIYIPMDLDINLNDLININTTQHDKNYLYIEQSLMNKQITITNCNNFIDKSLFIDYYNITGLLNNEISQLIPLNLFKNFKYFVNFDKYKIKNLNFKLVEQMLFNNFDNFKYYYKKFSWQLLIEICKDKKNLIFKIMELMNIVYSLNKYFLGEEVMDIKKLQENLFIKINENIPLETDEEFLLLYGQLFRYVINHSKSNDKSMNLVNFPLKCSNINSLKFMLKQKVTQYGYALQIKNKRLTNALENIYSYNFKGKVNQLNYEYLFVGLVISDNLFYRKKEVKNESEDIIDE